MSAPITIRMTLTNSLKGKTKKLNKLQFVDGDCLFTGSKQEVEGVTKYFTRSYQVDVKEVTAKTLKAEAEAAAIRVNDSDVLDDDKEADDKEAEPNERQIEIIAAVNGIEKDKWVDQSAKTPRPKAKDVQTIMDDPTITVAEIVDVIEEWLS